MFIMEKVSNEIIGLKLSLITLDIRIMKEFISDKDSIITFKDYIKYNKCTNKCYKYLLNQSSPKSCVKLPAQYFTFLHLDIISRSIFPLFRLIHQ